MLLRCEVTPTTVAPVVAAAHVTSCTEIGCIGNVAAQAQFAQLDWEDEECVRLHTLHSTLTNSLRFLQSKVGIRDSQQGNTL